MAADRRRVPARNGVEHFDVLPAEPTLAALDEAIAACANGISD